MKKILFAFILALFSLSNLFAQFTEEHMLKLEKRINEQDRYIENLSENMKAHAKQYRTGTGLIITGWILSAVYTGLLVSGNEIDNVHFIGGASGLMLTTGLIVQWNSNKWFFGGKKTLNEIYRERINTYYENDKNSAH